MVVGAEGAEDVGAEVLLAMVRQQVHLCEHRGSSVSPPDMPTKAGSFVCALALGFVTSLEPQLLHPAAGSWHQCSPADCGADDYGGGGGGGFEDQYGDSMVSQDRGDRSGGGRGGTGGGFSGGGEAGFKSKGPDLKGISR